MLKIGIRRIYHKTAYLCTWRTAARAHAKGTVEPCKSPEVMSHILEDKVFATMREHMLDVSKLKVHMDFFKKDYRADQKRVEWKLMRLDKNQHDIEKKKRRLIDAYISGQLEQEKYVSQNLTLDQEALKLKFKKEELLQNIPLLHKKDLVESSIQQFCDNAKVRLERCRDFDSKRQYLLDHIEKVIYERTKVTIVGAVPVRLGEKSDRTDQSKIGFRIESEFDKRGYWKKDRTRYLVDGRLKEWGSGGRDSEVHKTRMMELQSSDVKVSQITQQFLNAPLRESIGYTIEGRKKLQTLRKEVHDVYLKNINAGV